MRIKTTSMLVILNQKMLAYGDVSELKNFQEDHNCKRIKWFMGEIAYDITSHYSLPPKHVD